MLGFILFFVIANFVINLLCLVLIVGLANFIVRANVVEESPEELEEESAQSNDIVLNFEPFEEDEPTFPATRRMI